MECWKTHPKPTVQRMGPLPHSRIPSHLKDRPAPFLVTAIDVAGPWHVTQGRSTVKRWMLILHCAKVGAVCLEVLYGMDTDSFLNALTRFCAQFSKPKRFVCDNGTNFVGADKEINFLWKNVSKDGIQRGFPDIEFYWSPPHSPHFNGLVERMVGEAKKNLGFLIKVGERLSEDHLQTAFKEVQRLLNNRPLGTLQESIDGRDPEPLTPAHFLAGGNAFQDITMPRDRLDLKETPLAKRYLVLREKMDAFWARFVASMCRPLREFNKSRKWIRPRPPVVSGDVVCLLDQNPKERDQRYRMGVVVEAVAGEDGLPRRIMVRLADGNVVERGLNSLYVILPSENYTPPPRPESRTPRRSGRRRRKTAKAAGAYLITSRCFFTERAT